MLMSGALTVDIPTLIKIEEAAGPKWRRDMHQTPAHERPQALYFSSLSLQEKMEAVEAMADVVGISKR
jgi:hypothetical protein